MALQNAFQVSLTRSYSPSLRNKSRILKTQLILFVSLENTPITDNAIIATLDVCSLYTNIPQEEGIKVVCKYYNDHYQPNPPIPTSTLEDLMKLILKENSFHFNGKHFLQTHGIAMDTKMAVAFSVIFMGHVEKQLLLSSPHKPIIWKRFIDDIFSVWTSSKQEIDSFINFANRFHTTIKFTCEMSSERAVFLDTEVFKGPRFASNKVLDVQTQKATETFQYTHFSSCHPLSVKKGFIKGETLRLLRTNSIKEKFESSKRDFKFRLLERGYPQKLVNKIQAEVDFSSRNSASKYKPKTSKNILPFVTTYNPGVPKLKEILMKNWSLITNNPNLARIFPNAPIVAYKKDKSLKDLLVRAKIPPQPYRKPTNSGL